MRVLLVNGDPEIVEVLKTEIDKQYILDVAYNGEEGAYLSQINDYATIIVEEFLPDCSGVDVCMEVRNNKVTSPILMCMNEGATLNDRVRSIESGADVVLRKPIRPVEVVAYIHSLIRLRSNYLFSYKLEYADLVVDVRRRAVFVGKQQVILRRKEYDILHHLLVNIGRVVPRERLLDHVWENNYEVASNTLDVHIAALRRKLKRDYIFTVYGYGYKMG